MHRLKIYRISRVVPQTLSLLALIVCTIAWAGVMRDPPGDEGALAHVYQFSMVAQVPFIVFSLVAIVRFGFRQNAPIVVLQIALWVLAVAALRILHL